MIRPDEINAMVDGMGERIDQARDSRLQFASSWIVTPVLERDIRIGQRPSAGALKWTIIAGKARVVPDQRRHGLLSTVLDAVQACYQRPVLLENVHTQLVMAMPRQAFVPLLRTERGQAISLVRETLSRGCA